MVFIRSLIYQLFLITSVLLFGSTISLIGHFVPIGVIDKIANVWGLTNLVALKYICGLNYRLIGLENIPDSASIFVCKHQSSWETIALRAIFPKQQTWVVKQELVNIPVLGSALKMLQAIPIDRSSGIKALKQLIKRGTQSLNNGRNVMIFPEGTRVPPGSKGSYNVGAALLAEQTNSEIIPIAHNAGIFWGRRRLTKKPGTIDIIIGKSITTNGRKAQEVNQSLEDWIESTVRSLPIQ
jgi:1-acyl-sn-glycerol-3-phosphate acyltransferase